LKIISHKLSRTGATAAGDSSFGLMHASSNTETANSRWSWLYKISGVAALVAGALLLIAMAKPNHRSSANWLVIRIPELAHCNLQIACRIQFGKN